MSICARCLMCRRTGHWTRHGRRIVERWGYRTTGADGFVLRRTLDGGHPPVLKQEYSYGRQGKMVEVDERDSTWSRGLCPFLRVSTFLLGRFVCLALSSLFLSLPLSVLEDMDDTTIASSSILFLRACRPLFLIFFPCCLNFVGLFVRVIRIHSIHARSEVKTRRDRSEEDRRRMTQLTHDAVDEISGFSLLVRLSGSFKVYLVGSVGFGLG
jgi:hypothetical protein